MTGRLSMRVIVADTHFGVRNKKLGINLTHGVKTATVKNDFLRLRP